ncbi:MAG: AAA family ATPase [Gaiellaceae bacterium]
MIWQPIDLTADEHAQPSEPPAVLGLFYEGKRHALSGPPEAAKTLVALIAGLEWKRQGLGKFALLDFEQGPAATRLMLEELGATRRELRAVYYVEPDGPPTADDIAAIVDAGVTLLAVDAAAGAYDATGLDDNKRADAERFARLWIQPLWQRGVASIVLDHVVKNTETRGRYAIGSERKLGQVDVHLGLEAVTQITRAGHGLIRASVHKDRPAHLRRPHPCDLHLSSAPDTHEITWEIREPTATAPGTPDLPPAAAKLLEALAAQDEPASGAELVDWIAGKHGHGLKRETVSRHLNALRRQGLVDCTNPGAAATTSKLWQLAQTPDVTDVITRDDHVVTDVISPLREITRHDHNSDNGRPITTDEALQAIFEAGETT